MTTDGECISKVTNCSLANPDGTCFYCEKGYYESSGVCVKITIKGCVN